MRRLLLALAVFTAAPVFADEVKAKVTAVDEEEQKLLLDNGRLVVVDPGTDVFRDGAAVSVEEIQPGDEVRASFDALGQLRALELQSDEAKAQP